VNTIATKKLVATLSMVPDSSIGAYTESDKR
jgi:hypothetical protein